MTTLTEQLEAVQKGAAERVPADALDTMAKATQDLKDSGIEGKALQTGEAAPDFTLRNHLNEDRQLSRMLESGPLVVSFYRGGW